MLLVILRASVVKRRTEYEKGNLISVNYLNQKVIYLALLTGLCSGGTTSALALVAFSMIVLIDSQS